MMRVALLTLLLSSVTGVASGQPAPVVTPDQARTPAEAASESEQDSNEEGQELPTLPPTTVPRNSATPDTNLPPIRPQGNDNAATGDQPQVSPAPVDSPAVETITPVATPLPATQFGGTVRVIDAATIANSSATQLTDVLRSTAGVDVVQTGPPGSVSSIFLRGANSQHTKVLLNGIPLNEPSGPSRGFDFSTLSLDNVERIEVLQGPQGPLYGSDAVGGVINIVTRRGRDAPGVGASVLAGSYGTHREAGFARGAGLHFDYSVSGSWLDTDGFSSASRRVGGIERDGLQLGTLDGRFGLWSDETLEFEYFFRWIDGRTELDDAPFSLGTPPTDDFTRQINNQQFFQRVQGTWAPGDGLIEHIASFDLTDFDRDDYDDVFPFSTTGQSRRARYLANLQLTESNVLTAGGEYWAEDAGSIGFGSTSNATQNQRSAFLQDQWELWNRLYATAGVRWDDHSAAGSAFTYRVTLLGDVTETTRLRGSLGTGFRAPALAENLFPFGNPNLAPERSRGWEYGLDQRLTDRLSVSAVYFRNDLQNLILFDLNTFLLENIGVAKTHGVEALAEWRLARRWLVNGGYTRTDTLDRDTGQPLVRRPRDKGAIALTWTPDAGTALRLSTLIVGPRTDTRDGAVVLPTYTFMQLSGRRQLGSHARLIGRVDNLLDQRYEEATGFATAGLSCYAGVELTR